MKRDPDMQSIYSEFRKTVAATPDATAVQDGSRALTYAQLDALADTIAAGFPAKDPAYVGIVMDHGVEMIASILAVLKTGAAYVPAEPSFPIERIRYMMKESGVDFIITNGKYVDYIHPGFRKICVERGQEIGQTFRQTKTPPGDRPGAVKKGADRKAGRPGWKTIPGRTSMNSIRAPATGCSSIPYALLTSLWKKCLRPFSTEPPLSSFPRMPGKIPADCWPSAPRTASR